MDRTKDVPEVAVEDRAILNWSQDTRIDSYVKPDFDELSKQYQGRLKAQARRELVAEQMLAARKEQQP